MGKRVRLKNNVDLLAAFFEKGLDGYGFPFYVLSASPQDVVQSALEGIVPADRIFGTKLEYDASTGEISSINRVSAGYGKVAALQELETKLLITPDHTVYMGDGSSDLPVMMHVNQHDGLTIAVSEAKFITRVARRTVLSDNAMSVLVPVLEDVLRWDSVKIRRFFATRGLTLREWDKMRTDLLTIGERTDTVAPAITQ